MSMLFAYSKFEFIIERFLRFLLQQNKESLSISPFLILDN